MNNIPEFPKPQHYILPLDRGQLLTRVDTQGKAVLWNFFNILAKRQEWVPISWQEYTEDCEPQYFLRADKECLDKFVERELLTFEEDKYCITETMISIFVMLITGNENCSKFLD